MLDENINDPLIGIKPLAQSKSLYEKYISIDNLNFEYVSNCKNVRELERIVKILRSGEEGHYPDLLKCSEEQLKKLSPNSRLLRVEEPIIRRESLLAEERDQVDNEMKEWVENMSTKDEELMDWNKHNSNDVVTSKDQGGLVSSASGDFIPPVRRAPQKKSDCSKKQTTAKKIMKPVVSDYKTWDKYDADSELLKMDLEEERRKTEEEIRLKKEKAAADAANKKTEHSRLNCLINSSKNMPDAEKSFHALREKDRGNEYYKTCNYEDAIEYYTASIAISPNAVAYGNRAASYLKLGKYDLALSDANKCLELDPENTKGLYRRGLCLQHKNKFDEALLDMQAVLRKEPHNLLVQHVAKELREQCSSVPRSVRMLVEQEENEKVVEVSETEVSGLKTGFEVNEWGLAKSMCTCYRQPPFLRMLNKSGIADHLIYTPEEDKKKIKKKVPEKDKLNHVFKLQPENVISDSCGIELMCNGKDEVELMETNRIAFGRNADNEEDNLIPKKIKIIETVKTNSESSSGVKERDKQKKCVVKDMRGQKHVQGQNESEMTEQFSNISIDESATGASKIENARENSNNKSTPNKKQNNNREINERNNQLQQNRNYNFNVPSEKQPITIASKYTQKVDSLKNLNAQSDTLCNHFSNINNNLNNNSNIISSGNVCNENSITPHQFSNLWSAVKNMSSLREYANILRRIQPSKLHTILGNKLDDKMLSSMLKTLSSEFDVSNPEEADLVKNYLVSLSTAERFDINMGFMPNDVKNLTNCLIDKVGGEDASSLKKKYHV